MKSIYYIIFIYTLSLLVSGCHEASYSHGLGVECTKDNDCRDPYICQFGRCRSECSDNSDCPDGVCVPSPKDPEVKVCTLQIESGCQEDEDCPQPLVCGSDQICRPGCHGDDDCQPDFLCFLGTCFEKIPDAAVDVDAADGADANDGTDTGASKDAGGPDAPECPTGYTGDQCQSCAVGYTDYGDNTCLPSDPCKNNTTCTSDNRECVNKSGTAECGDCLQGFHTDSTDGCVRDESCKSDSCSGNGSCDDSEGVVSCTCKNGFEGSTCAECNGCAVGDICYSAGQINPDNLCQSCQPDVSDSDFNPVADDTPCADDNLCNGDETCQAGTCTDGVDLNCSDSDPCTDDLCDPATGCANSYNTNSCDDDDPLTTDDRCDNGHCIGRVDLDQDQVADGDYAQSCTDGQTDNCNDNCPAIANTDQLDDDGNGIGDVCQNINAHVWAPDSSKIAYVRCPIGQTYACDLTVADPDFGNRQVINQDVAWDGLVDWQGDYILFRKWTTDGSPATYDKDGEYWRIRSDGSGLTQVTYTFTNGIRTVFTAGNFDNMGTAVWARFIPGTDKVYFLAHNGNGWYSTYTCNSDGSDDWEQISENKRGWNAAISPVGDRLIYSYGTNFDVNMDITSVDLEGDNPIVVRSALASGHEYAVSPDGSTMAYEAPGPSGGVEIRLVDMDGSNDRLLVSDTATAPTYNRLRGFHDSDRRWVVDAHWYPFSPVSSRLLYSRKDSTTGVQIHEIKLDGTEDQALTSGSYYHFYPKYSPDGKWISYHRVAADCDLYSVPWPTELIVERAPGLLEGVTRVVVGGAVTCAIFTDDTADCWGQKLGGLGDDDATTASVTPVSVGLSDVVDVTVRGADFSCAVLQSGEVYCWGSNNDWGQLGQGDYTPRNVPTVVPGISDAVAVDIGGETTCALLADETLRCWGRNEQKQVGSGSSISKLPTPQVVSNLTEVAQVSVGRWMTCAIKTGGQAYCWGDDYQGGLGNGDTTTTQQSTPVEVNNLSDAVAISAGYSHACAVRAGGQVVCWGEGESGELGDGLIHSVDEPVPVQGISNAVDVKAFDNHSCALLDDGSVSCWGDNTYGQLGNGSYDSSDTPVPVKGLTGATQLSGGSWTYHVCALAQDGLLRCWGNNSQGQLGGETTMPRNLPGVVAF